VRRPDPRRPAAWTCRWRCTALKAQGIDLSVFTDMLNNHVLYPSPVHGNGAALQDAIEPLFEAYFAGQKNDSVFADMQSQSKTLLAKN
jgi:multiple sugar transport system substrate-binding protein